MLALSGLDFTVVGVLDKTLTAPDRFAMVAIEDARELWLRRDPLLVQVFGAGGLGRADLNSGAAVGWQPGVDPDDLARRIQSTVDRPQRDDSRRAEPAAPRVHGLLLGSALRHRRHSGS